jgi:lipopolysaccharide export system protein LptA
VAFDAAGRVETVVMRDGARVEQRVAAGVRTATGATMTLRLGADGQPREVEAAGAARVVQEEGAGRSEISGDELQGVFGAASGWGRVVLRTVHGVGHTVLHRVLETGGEQTSRGDALDVELRAGRGEGNDAVAKATQTGHTVLVMEAAPAKGKPAGMPSRATAERAVYDGDAEELTLTGSPRVEDAAGTVEAERIVVEQGSGDAVATGGVRATYAQPGPAGPVHVTAERGELQHEGGRAIFRAGARPVRMWQGATQVEAPSMELEKEGGRLTAAGPGVSTVLVTQAGVGGKASVVRVRSGSMEYLEGAREVRFLGSVVAEDGDGVVRSREATAFLAPAAGSAASKAAGATSKSVSGIPGTGGVERIVAKGVVEIEEPGRHGFGEQLVYTPGAVAGDGLYVLTGTAAVPPRLVDEARGTVTGERLTFHSGDRSVAVHGGAGGPRARTVTRVKSR